MILYSTAPPGLDYEFIASSTVASAVTTLTFSGLNGNSDRSYRILGSVLGSGSNLISLQPNAITTNQATRTSLNAATGGGGVAGYLFTSLRLGTLTAAAWHTFDVTFNAVINGAIPRTFFSNFSRLTSGNLEIFHSFGTWQETSTNITSMVIYGDVASGIGVGSNFQLYRLRV